ncbi:hypothetical protein Golob_024973 [Gossypium lobatum]|uniref:Uncharacterized protein n=1 Tax=Gossypium lobatum TaxID=34289 RepID=A0A7J8NE24_9ROSI|nr:hypothetical protein [Gossypium lobatum]
MATEAISGNEDENIQSFNTATHAGGSSAGPGNASLRRIQQFPKHDIVKLVVDTDGNLVPNPEFLFHKQQDKLLAS